MRLVKELYGAVMPYDFLYRTSIVESVYDQYQVAKESFISKSKLFKFEDKVDIQVEGDVARCIQAIGLLAICTTPIISRFLSMAMFDILMYIKEKREVRDYSYLGNTGEEINKIIEEVIKEYGEK